MRTFRKVVFWLHLVCGVAAGLAIGVMSFTGAVLAFEKEIVAFVERDVRRVAPPVPAAKPLSLDEVLRQVREARPDFRPAGLVITGDPGAAIALLAGGRGGTDGAPSLYANPYTGEVREAQSRRTRAFMRTMNTWHRWLGVEGEHRAVARAVTGACNVAFLFLGVSGLLLWWPRSWSPAAVRAVSLPDCKARGKARDFNWHNAIGLWSAPVLIVLTATALPISYRWAGDLIYRVTGTEPPARGAAGAGGFAATPMIEVTTPSHDVRPLSYDALVASVRRKNPEWEQITLRLGPTGGTGRREGMRRKPRNTTKSALPAATEPARPAPAGPQAITIVLKTSGSWPRTTATTLLLDPFTGAVLRQDGFTDQNLGRRVRTWTRFLHTGEALGLGGQLIAGLASAGGCVLAYTGLALAWRRFCRRRPEPAPDAAAADKAGARSPPP